MRFIIALLLLFCCAPAISADSPYTYLLRDIAGRVDWGTDGRIAFDRLDERGWFQVWTMQANGSKQKCLTCNERFPRLHNGNPAWHPSGKFIVYQAVDDSIPVPFWGELYKLYTSPGAGVNNNIWIITGDGKRAWPMTDLGKGRGVLHPHFSPDGTKLVWAEMTSTKPMPTGQWVITVADFSAVKGVPQLKNVQRIAPGDMQFYETHGFSPDSTQLLFTGLHKDKKNKHFDIYKYTFASGALQALTDEGEEVWDEHAHFSPDGSKIIWMSSKGNDGSQKGAFVKTDWWVMDADGSNKRRLTWFNKKGAPEYIKGKAIAADVSWSPAGGEVMGYLQDNATAKKPGHIVKFRVSGAE